MGAVNLEAQLPSDFCNFHSLSRSFIELAAEVCTLRSNESLLCLPDDGARIVFGGGRNYARDLINIDRD